jgi:hypothetical protein
MCHSGLASFALLDYKEHNLFVTMGTIARLWWQYNTNPAIALPVVMRIWDMVLAGFEGACLHTHFVG